MIYTISEEEEPISSYASESESNFNPNSNSDNNNDKNNSSSSISNSNENYDNSNSNSNPETFIALLDLTKEQELKWFSNSSESIMLEHVHDMNAEFDLRYPENDPIKLEPHLCTYIDLKIALEILVTTMGINIRGGIIDAEYVGNIIAILQNNSKKTYTIEPNKKIAQAIFLSLVKIAQLVLVGSREKLRITAKEIQEFGSTDRIDVSVNMAEEKIIDKGEIISTHQSISIPSYSQYMLAIKREQKSLFVNQKRLDLLIFTYQSKAKNIKILIYNTTENVIEIPKGTIIKYLTTEVEDQLPNHISDFLQLCGYINMGNLNPFQQMQLRMLLSNFNDIFASENEFGCTNIIQHQIKTVTTTLKVVTQTDLRTLEYYQSIYTHCKQRFNIPDGIETFKKTLYQYIENHINNYLFGDYNISEVRHNLYKSLIHHSCLNTQNFNSQTLKTYFQELNFNIIQYCEENYPIEQKFSLSFKSETETSNKDKQKAKQHSKTTPNTPILTKTTAKHLQTPEQRTSFKLPLSITPFPASLVQPQTPSLPLIWFSRIEDFQSPKSPIQQQEPISTSTNLIDYLTENRSEETKSEQETKDSENKEKMVSTYIAKISEFTGENNETISKARDANGWNAARILKAISYFLYGMTGEWFENLEAPPEHWEAFKTAFLEQFTNNNTSITLRNWFQNIKQEPNESVMTYLGKFNKLLRRICQLKTNEYYSNAQILDQFIAGLKDKLIKKVCSHAPEDLATAIQQAKNYEMAMKKANHTKLVNLAIKETSSAAEKKIDQLNKKPTPQPIQQQYQQSPTQYYQVPARKLITQNQFTPQNQYQVNNNRISSNNQLVP
ncbi:hypothetical protein G9A89_018397 [Geosiphon pyriformis]|nr:hypothetical protein G9A89_018397 [Geosiphon pyriformis]